MPRTANEFDFVTYAMLLRRTVLYNIHSIYIYTYIYVFEKYIQNKMKHSKVLADTGMP